MSLGRRWMRLSRNLLPGVLVAWAVAASGCASGGAAKTPSPDRATTKPPARALSTRLAVGGSPAAPAPAAAPARPAVAPARVPAYGGALTNRPGPVTNRPGSEAVYRLKVGDPILVNLRGIPREEQHEDRVDENGMIKLTHIGSVRAAGRTTAEIEDEIERMYIEGKIYRQVFVTVVTPQQSCFVQGEVKEPGTVPIISGLTLLQAIASARGYSEFADPAKIKVMRGEQVLTFNALELQKAPERDPVIEPGDVIVVPRHW